MSGSEVLPGPELVEKSSYPDLARSPSQGVYVVVRGVCRRDSAESLQLGRVP